MSQNTKQEHKVTHYSIVRSATALLDYAKKHKITYEMLDDKTRAQWNELLGLLEEIEDERRKAERNLAREAKAIVAWRFAMDRLRPSMLEKPVPHVLETRSTPISQTKR